MDSGFTPRTPVCTKQQYKKSSGQTHICSFIGELLDDMKRQCTCIVCRQLGVTCWIAYVSPLVFSSAKANNNYSEYL